MSKIMHAGRSLLELLLIMAIGLVPVVSGLLVMVFQLEKKLEENAQVSVQEAVFTIDKVLDRMHRTAMLAQPFAGKTCAEALSALHDQVARDPLLRSLTLVQDQGAYCSTHTESLEHLSSFAQSRQDVELAFDSPVLPNALVTHFQDPDSNPGVIVTGYATELRNELRAFQDGLMLLLEFGDQYIWSHGDSRDPQRPSQSEYAQRAVSAKYGYAVRGGYGQGHTAQEIRQSALQILPSLVLVGIVTGSIIYWGLFRARGNRRGTAANKA
ncbi:TPA: CSS-motif domain-containing protein [Pseudomonas putida]|nr:CSS-motif domain-containing protein [Pseudomonas putida]